MKETILGQVEVKKIRNKLFSGGGKGGTGEREGNEGFQIDKEKMI